MIKKIILSAAVCLSCLLAMAQTTNVHHVVQRGETIESIAEYYHVSVDDINKANPSMGGLIYVGMKLVVPQVKNEEKLELRKNCQNAFNKASVQISYKDSGLVSDKTVHANSPLKFKVFAGVTCGQWIGKDYNEEQINEDDECYAVKCKSLFSFHVGVNLDYFFTKNFYAGLGFMFNQTGYKKEQNMNSGKYWNDDGGNYERQETTKMTVNKFTLPIHIGGVLKVAHGIELFLEAGPQFSYVLSGNKKTTGYLTTHEDIHSSEIYPINEKVNIGDSELKDYTKFGYGISATSGVLLNDVCLQFSFERGLSKTIKKTKQYEQNLLLSVGYVF